MSIHRADTRLMLTPELGEALLFARFSETYHLKFLVRSLADRNLFNFSSISRDMSLEQLVLAVIAMIPDDKREMIVDHLMSLLPDYYISIERGNPNLLRATLANEFPFNFQDPETGDTALHVLASRGARPAIRVLARDSSPVNYLLRNKRGQLPSELAFVYGNDPALCRFLEIKEKKQAIVNEQALDVAAMIAS